VEDIEVEVIDGEAVLRAILAKQLPMNVVQFAMGDIKRLAAAMKATSLPGIRITKTSRVRTRAA